MADVDQIGNTIVGSSLLVMAVALLAGTLGVAFVGELAAIALLVTGLMMMRGLFGDNATVGFWMAVLGPAAIVLPPFFAVLAFLPLAAGVLFAVLGVIKFFGVW